MKKFHILYKVKDEDHLSASVLLEAVSPIEALTIFHEAKPDTVFLAMFTFELAESMYRSLK